MEILIVDDELVSRKTLQKLLENLGKCRVAESGEEALSMIKDEIPDLILLDIIMPGIDGYNVCETLKADRATKEVPVIFLSANANIEDITRGFELGAVDYITKPFHKAEVKARVRTHLSIRKMQADICAKNSMLEQKISEIKVKTEQLRQKDLQLIEMDRIAGIGTLAAGIAHEINNPLGFVKSSIGFLKKSIEKLIRVADYWDDQPLEDELRKAYKELLDGMNYDHMKNSMDRKFDRVERGVERIITIVNSMRRFSRVDLETVGHLDINQSIDDAVTILNSEDVDAVEFVKELGQTPLLECSTSEINQVLLHILKNALDAVEGNGRVKVMSSFNEKKEQISLQVVDNGNGMSPEVLRQALNPFFTTKQVGSGTGTGLSMTEAIIKRHGGTISIVSEEEKGTTVTVMLPVAGQKAGVS